MNELSEHFKINISLGKSKPNFTFQGQKYRITILSDVLIRLEYSETGSFNDYPTLFAINRQFKKDPVIEVKEDEKYINITNEYFILEYTKEKPFEASKLIPDTNLRISLKDSDKVWYYNHPEIRNFKSTTHSFDTEKNFQLEKGLYSTDGFASLNDTDRPVFVSDGSIKKNPSDGVDIYLFVYKNDYAKALQSYFELTGRPELPPRYALGITWNKDEPYTNETLKELLENFQKSEVPLSSILLGKNWKKQPKDKENTPNYEFDKEKITNPENLIKELHDKKVYLGLNITTENGINPTDTFYNEAKAILKTEDNTVLPVNVYNTKLLDSFYKKVINPLLDTGIDYFLIDDKTKDKINLFMLCHYTYKNYSRQANRRGLIYSRNHGISSHRYPVLYSGVTQVSWKVLKYLPYFNSSSSNIGLSWWSHDIGGYINGIEDRELYIRYVQLGVYSPIFRFSSTSGRYYKREPWKWDVKTEKIVIDYTKLRQKLIPYLYTEGYIYSRFGIPIIQPLYYQYPETYDEPLYKNEYFFGSQLFVSPITDPKDSVMNRVVHRIFLPKGTWYDFKTGKKFTGGKRYVTFYKDEDYPVYAKSGAIIPLANLNEENINDTNPPKELEIHIFPGENNSYNLYEDDGITTLNKEGYYIITNIEYNYKPNNYTLVIKPIEGKSGIIPEKRDYKIRFRNTKNAEYIKANIGIKEVVHKSYTEENDFIIEIKDVPTTSQLTINCGGKAIEIDGTRLINEDIDEIVSDLQIETTLKETIADIIFSDKEVRKKRIEIRKLRSKGLKTIFIKMFIKLLEYTSE